MKILVSYVSSNRKSFEPDYLRAYDLYLNCLIKIGDFKAAKACFEQMRISNPNDIPRTLHPWIMFLYSNIFTWKGYISFRLHENIDDCLGKNTL